MKVKTNFKEMYLVDKFLYNKILNSSQTFNNSSSKFNIINKLPPPPNESASHHDPSSNENNISMKRNECNENQIEPNQNDNVEKQEQGNNTHPPNNVHDCVHTKAENTLHSPPTNQIEQMQIDNDENQGQGNGNNTHPSNIVHDHVLAKDKRMNNVTHTEVSNMDIDISPPNHLPNQSEQTHPPSTLQLPSLSPREISSSSSFQLRGDAPLTHAPPRGGVPPPTPQINTQSADNECVECATPIDYESYRENGAIPRTKNTYATIYTCTLCNTDFKTRKSLERHMKNMHAAYSQKEKGKKRKNENEHELKKRIKRNYSYYLES